MHSCEGPLHPLWFIHNEHHTNINFVAFNLLLLHVCRKIVHINNIRGYICIWVRWVILTIIFSRPNNFKVFNIGVDEGGGSRILAYVSHILVGCHTLPMCTQLQYRDMLWVLSLFCQGNDCANMVCHPVPLCGTGPRNWCSNVSFSKRVLVSYILSLPVS